MRFVRGLLTAGFALFGAALVGGALLLFLGATGRSAPVLRALSSGLARVLAGQHIDQMMLAVEVDPGTSRLRGTARLDVRAVAARRRLYFLLSNGLRVESVRLERAGGESAALAHTQLWMITAVELPEMLPAEESVRIAIAYGGDPLASALPIGGGASEAGEILLQAEDLWYPLDLQSFTSVDVEVTLPTRLALVHNGDEVSRADLGSSQRVRWTSTRPVPGVALIAGEYEEHASESEGIRYRVFLPRDVGLDADRILASLAAANRDLTSYFGSSGFARLTAFVSRRAARSSFDGSGVIALRAAAFRAGDYGFSVLAHEVAHSWWGATVAARWLEADTGGQWLVEGFAGLASWWAVGKSYGETAQFQQRRAAAFDPAAAGPLNAASALDGRIDAAARDAIYDKGAFVAFMLQQRLGEATFGEAARQFLGRYRYRAATARDLEAVFSEVSGQDLAPFFADWVYSDARLDLALDPRDGDVVVANHQSAAPPAQEIALWRAAPGTQPEVQGVAVGASTPLGNVERLVLDPQALLADMYRSNNVLPRAETPRRVARSATGALFVVEGEAHSWMPARVRHIDAKGTTLQVWDLDRGLLRDPVWSADGSRVIAVEAARGGAPNVYALHASDGEQRAIGHDPDISATADGVLVARGRELKAVAGERATTLVRLRTGRIDAALGSPDGSRVAYAVRDGDAMELRAVGADGRGDRVLLTWPAGPLFWHWGPDGARLFAVLGGDWDWQLWELPLDDSPRVLIREAAAIRDFAVSPDGARLAVVAQEQARPGLERFELFVFDRGAVQAVQRFNLSGNDCHSAAWLDDDHLLVIVSDVTYPAVPEARALRKLRLSDSSLLEFP